MKKVLLILIVVVMLLTACSIRRRSELEAAPQTQPTIVSAAEATSEPTAPPTTEAATQPTETTAPAMISLPLPQEGMEFSFLSGAGGWRTVLWLNRDGTFTGAYSDSEMGEMGDDYPNGSIYLCNFYGRFEIIEQVNDYTYAMTMAELITENPEGEEWIEDKIRYVASEPYGLNDPLNGQECTDFILYLPDTPVDQVPEEFLSWWPYRHAPETERKATLSCYGILNVTTEYGFFTEG